jgi:membrane protein DedA with SNARE-associated domain
MPRYDLKNNRYLKYSGLALQIFVSIAVAAYFGKWLDRKFDLEKPIMTALCSILMLIMMLIWINYDLKRKD